LTNFREYTQWFGQLKIDISVCCKKGIKIFLYKDSIDKKETQKIKTEI
jgi:hypothetical protein